MAAFVKFFTFSICGYTSRKSEFLKPSLAQIKILKNKSKKVLKVIKTFSGYYNNTIFGVIPVYRERPSYYLEGPTDNSGMQITVLFIKCKYFLIVVSKLRR